FAADGAVRARDLDEALALARSDLDHRAAETPAQARGVLWVIGGGRVYAEAMARADLLVVTEIDLEVDGDTRAPEIPGEFRLVEADPAEGWLEAANGLRHRVLTYRR